MFYMSANQTDPQYKLRWSEELRDKIQESAKQHNRSMNADIIARLEQSFNENQQQESTIADLNDQIQHLKMSFDVLVKALSDKKAP